MFNDVELTFSNVELVFNDVEHNFYLGPGILRACKMRKVCCLCHLFVFPMWLSSIIPLYNCRRYIGVCLDSIMQ